MKHFFFALIYIFVAVYPVNSAQPRVDLDFSKATISDIATIVYRDIYQGSYVLEPEINDDKRLVSVRLQTFVAKQNWADLLDNLGYRFETKNAVDYISIKTKKQEDVIYIYQAKYKSVDDIKNAMAGLFVGVLQASKNELIFKGSIVEKTLLINALKQFDTKEKELMIKGYVYEVRNTKTDGSGIQLVGELFKNAGIAVVNGIKASNYLSFKNKDFDLAISALTSDSRFKILSNPHLRVRNHTKASLIVGQDVPVLGSVSYDNNNRPIQSVEYRSSGVIFELLPEILDKIVNLEVNQELSNFAETITGVNNSPTLIKRQIKTNISTVSGQVLILGGLIEDKETNTNSGVNFLPNWLASTNKTTDTSEIVLLLCVEVL